MHARLKNKKYHNSKCIYQYKKHVYMLCVYVNETQIRTVYSRARKNRMRTFIQ